MKYYNYNEPYTMEGPDADFKETCIKNNFYQRHTAKFYK